MQLVHLRVGLWIALAIAVVAAICLVTPVRILFDHMALIMHLNEWGSVAAIVFVGVFAIATVFGLPGTVLAIAGGAVFGLGWGTFWSVLGATLGAVGAFWVARYWLHGWAERHFGHHPILQRLKRSIAHHPLSFVLMVRFAPISPFNLVNFLFGLTPIDLKTYTIGTFFGIIPGTLAYTWLGVTGNQALHGGDRVPFVLALGLLALLSVLPMLKRKT